MAASKQRIEKLLVPGGGGETLEFVHAKRRDTTSAASWFCYALLSSIKLAIRERASDQNRSTERSDRSRHSAVSDVVSPAK